MSRCYEISITIAGHNSANRDAIMQSLRDLEYEEDCDVPFIDEPGEIIQYPSDTINIPSSISSEFAVAKEIHHAVWKANGDKFCEVAVTLRDLDDPTPTYEGAKPEFEEYIANKT